ncbi:cytochrome P450 monooxygenase [Pyrenophora seminiperda CCB06]|uniref:Cytochrome P450 monooxygenase n=1 Tax=Pyrenophora seminiperda CCB06 TaxID=1302712 RepID=A0A3M7MFN5_9PLEO|nr:cytochrome P450 monooxygenase [Pyrenophora seminiperda CCB06]
MLLVGKQHTYYYQLHMKYGPAVRVCPDEVVFSTPEAWDEVYGYRRGNNMEKSPIFIGAVSPMNGCVGIGLAKGKEHARQRRALAPSLSKNALKGQEAILQVHVNKLIAAIRNVTAKQEPMNMANWFTYITFDIMGDLCFAKPFGCLDEGAATEWSTSVGKVLTSATYDQAIRRAAGADSWLRIFLLRFIPKEVAQWRMTHLNQTKEKTLARIADKDLPHQDIMYHLLQAEDSQKGLNPTEIILNMVLFVLAGSETTSIQLTALAHLLCTNPDAYKKLVEEIRSNFEKTTDITLATVMELPYLTACAKEANRLYPPGAVAGQRSVPSGGATIHGHYIPAGSTVAVSHWVASRSPLNFTEPDQFRPQRWFSEGKYAQDKLHASRPFGYGPKSCLGQNMAEFEVNLIFSHLLFNFDMELAQEPEHAEDNRKWVTAPDKSEFLTHQTIVKPNFVYHSSTLTVVFGCLGLIVWYIYTCFRSWYRLRHIPTPSILASFSYLWLGRSTFSGKQYWVHRELNAKYGPFVRIGPNEILTDDVGVIKQICSSHSSFHRSSWYQTGRFNPYHDNLLSITGTPAHKELKTRVLTAIGARENPGIERAIDEQIEILLRVIRTRYVPTSPEKKQPLLDIGPVSLYFTMDVTTRLVLGKEIGDMEDEKDHSGFLQHVADLWPQMSTSADVPWIRRIIFSPLFLILFGPKVTDKKGFGKLMAFANGCVEKRYAAGDKDQSQDMLASMMRNGFSRKECEINTLLLLLSGTESTACAIRAVLSYVVTTPSVYFKLKEEITSAIRDGLVSSPITFAQAKKLPYLQAVIYEGIRMRTPLLGLWPKWSASANTLHGTFIPAGTNICMNTSSLLRSTKYFGHDADVYNPERFMALDREARMEMEHHAELAFGTGQWMCAGKNIALTEINKLTFELLRNFDMQMANPVMPHKIQSYGIFLESGMYVKFTEDVSRA